VDEHKHIERNGSGRRKYDGTCALHDTHEGCFVVIKGDIKLIEAWQADVEHRLSAIEPTVEHNKQEIDSMRRLQLATLVTGLVSAIGVISGLCLLILRHLATGS